LRHREKSSDHPHFSPVFLSSSEPSLFGDFSSFWRPERQKTGKIEKKSKKNAKKTKKRLEKGEKQGKLGEER